MNDLSHITTEIMIDQTMENVPVEYQSIVQTKAPLIHAVFEFEDGKFSNGLNKDLLTFLQMYKDVFHTDYSTSATSFGVAESDFLKVAIETGQQEDDHHSRIEKVVSKLRQVYRKEFRAVAQYMTSGTLKGVHQVASEECMKQFQIFFRRSRLDANTHAEFRKMMNERLTKEQNWIDKINDFNKQAAVLQVKAEAFEGLVATINNEFPLESEVEFYEEECLIFKISQLISDAVKEFKNEILFEETDQALNKFVAEFEQDLKDKVQGVLVAKNAENKKNVEKKVKDIVQECKNMYKANVTAFVKETPFCDLNTFQTFHLQAEASIIDELKEKTKDYSNANFRGDVIQQLREDIFVCLKQLLDETHADANERLETCSRNCKLLLEDYMRLIEQTFKGQKVQVQMEDLQVTNEEGIDKAVRSLTANIFANKDTLENILQTLAGAIRDKLEVGGEGSAGDTKEQTPSKKTEEDVCVKHIVRFPRYTFSL